MTRKRLTHIDESGAARQVGPLSRPTIHHHNSGGWVGERAGAMHFRTRTTMRVALPTNATGEGQP